MVTEWARSVLPTDISVNILALSIAGVYSHINPRLWSLRVEIIYSTLFPLIIILVSNRKTRRYAIIGLGLLALLPLPIAYATQYGIAFAAGAALPYWEKIGGWWNKAIFWVAIAILICARGLLEAHGIDQHTIQIVEMTAAIAIVRGLYSSTPYVAVLRSRSLLFLGDVSFGVSLLHFSIAFSLAEASIKLGAEPAIQSPPILATVLLTFGTLCVAIPLSWATYWRIEIPMLQIGKKFARGPRGSRADAVHAIDQPV